MYQLVITNRATSDLAKARDWYNARQDNLGFKFLDFVFKSFDEIVKKPNAYPSKHKHTRELVVKKYPYIVVYSIEENFIFILRVFPCKTNPKGKYKK